MTKVSKNPAITRRGDLFCVYESSIPCDNEKSRYYKMKVLEILRDASVKICAAADDCDKVDIGQMIAGMDALLEARLKFNNAATLGCFDVEMEKEKKKRSEDK